MASAATTSSRDASASARSVSQKKKSSESITADFAISAQPQRHSRSSRVASVAVEAHTYAGCLNAPTRFFPAARFTPVLPPTEESTIANSVVGTCTTGMPRMYDAATKPARSPTTPPPKATIAQSRVRPMPASASQISPATTSDFESSPAGTVMSLTRKPAERSDSFAFARYSGATLVSVITTKRGARAIFSILVRYLPRPSSTSAPMRTL